MARNPLIDRLYSGLGRIERMLLGPWRLVVRERRARNIAECSTAAEIRVEVDRLQAELESFARTADYKRSVERTTEADLYERRVTRIERDLRAHVRAWAIVRTRDADRASSARASSTASDRRNPLEGTLSWLDSLRG